MSLDPETSPDLRPDPLYQHSLNEARWILGLWGICFLYTVVYCYCFGYLSHEPHPTAKPAAVGEAFGPLPSLNRDPDSLTYPFGLGIPDWVFYGVALPWLICGVLTFAFCYFIYVEDDLAAEGEGQA